MPTRPQPVLLQSGFRPFFLLGTLYAAVSLAAWLLIFAGVGPPGPGAWPGLYWHGHEMIFGFVATAIAGFLLTAVPNWTGTARLEGRALVWLVALWLAGRVALWAALLVPGFAPGGLVAAADLVFLPALAVAVGRPILAAGVPRNYPVLAVLGVLTLGNLGMHAAALGVGPVSLRQTLDLSLYAVVVLVTLISGRIVPAFTRNPLARHGMGGAVTPAPGVERALYPVMLAAVALVLLREASPATGLACLACGALLVVRQAGWQPHRVLDQPLLWVLHAGHAWLAVGFLCLGANALWAAFPASTALHALSAGAIGTMIVGVMTRVALGHSGRELEATPLMVAAYGLVIAGGAIRVVSPLVLADAYLASILVAGAAWAAGYLLTALACWRILTGPRVDGRAG